MRQVKQKYDAREVLRQLGFDAADAATMLRLCQSIARVA